jgi:3-phytase
MQAPARTRLCMRPVSALPAPARQVHNADILFIRVTDMGEHGAHHPGTGHRAALLALVLALASALAGCATGGLRGDRVVSEAWISDGVDQNIDSVASWLTGEGKVLVLATARHGNAIRVHDGDSGEFLRTIGTPGSGVGELARPNGIFVADDLAFVVEKGNHRVQVFDLARNEPVGVFGAAQLREPYGLWVQPQHGRRFRVYVTDSYYTDGRVPPDAELGERVKSFDVSVDGAELRAEYRGAFGDTSGAGVLRTIESIWGDPAHGRLLIADEDPSTRDIKVYDADGRYLQTFGTGVFRHEPEGIARVDCAGDDGYWIVSDQHARRQAFRVFDRQSLQHVGDFVPAAVHTVDGIWFQPGHHGRFAQGALYSQHANVAVAAFDWRSIATALSLRDDCGR